MKFATFASLAVFAASGLGGASGANATDVMKSTTIDHPAEKVWALIGEYGQLDKWHPAVVKLELSGDGGNGVFRTLTLPDGAAAERKAAKLLAGRYVLQLQHRRWTSAGEELRLQDHRAPG